MNVQWNSEQFLKRVSQGGPSRMPGMANQRQTGRISTTSGLGRVCRTRQNKGSGAQSVAAQTRFCQLGKGPASNHLTTATGAAVSSVASTDYQAALPLQARRTRLAPRAVFLPENGD